MAHSNVLPIAGSNDVLVEFCNEVGGFYFRSIFIADAGVYVQQHVHDYDHATYIGSGAVRLWADGGDHQDFSAGQAVEIKAGSRHTFMSLEPNTRLTCIHDALKAEKAGD